MSSNFNSHRHLLCGSGLIVASSASVAIGHIHKGLDAFGGEIERVRVFDVAKTKAELQGTRG